MRKIPTTMVSQHPDHAGVPYWHNQAFISTNDETQEAFLSFSELGVSEYKWDWEGKLVDESVMERLFSEHYDYFKRHPLGRDKFITFRLPNPKVETEFRVGRAFMSLLSASALANHIKLYPTPLFEVILPMTETATDLIALQEAFREIAGLKHELYRLSSSTLRHLDVIPLFEHVDTITGSDGILREYVSLHKDFFGIKPDYIRPYLARSDPALNSGMVATVLAIKVALSRYRQFGQESGIKLYPIIGSASLPFRGGLTPHSVEAFTKEYRGVRTALLQSAFRYDYDKPDVIKAISQLQAALPRGNAAMIPADQVVALLKQIKLFEGFYQSSISGIADTVNLVAGQLPRRRERVQHIGLFGYSRGVNKVKLPRAIGFTAALYSLGIPPEFIGTGRGLRAAAGSGQIKLIEKYYLNLRADLRRAGRFLNRPVLKALAKTDLAWAGILDDVVAVEEYLGEPLEPVTAEELEHLRVTKQIYAKMGRGEPLTKLIEATALLRRSLG